MPRIVLDISYDGTAYAGWQKQPNALAIQEVLDGALGTVLRQAVATTGAGRTDAGVHATQLFVHADIQGELPQAFLRSLNGVLPEDIAVKAVYRPLAPAFHTRFDALSRAYEYHITRQKAPLDRHRSLWVRQVLDIKKMQEAAHSLLHYEDFASFCKAHGNQGTTLCTLMRAEWEPRDHQLVFHIKANRFLRGMVRAVVGTLLEVGTGKRDLASFKKVVEARKRSAAGANVAAHGLVLTEVNYPEGALERVF